MSHYGLLGSYQFGDLSEDIRGAALYGQNDEKLGKIDDVIFDHSTGDIAYLVVDTGGWLRAKKFLLPAREIRYSTKHEGEFSCALTRQRIEAFPPYKENDLGSRESWVAYENQYRAKWVADPVMHRAETDRNITPTTQQMEGNRESMRASGQPLPPAQHRTGEVADVDAAEAPTGRVVPAGVDTVVIENSAVGIGGRWDTFQARLRERRKEAATGCRTCSFGPGTLADAESAETLKNAV